MIDRTGGYPVGIVWILKAEVNHFLSPENRFNKFFGGTKGYNQVVF